jgi:isoleucyl-tRNA synthetase
MAIVQQIVVMGRALREKATMRVRQPLRALHVRSSDPRSLLLLATTFAREQILEELNIKTIGSLAADDGKLCRLTAKANFKLLGKRLGPRMKDAAAAIAALDAGALARLRAGERVAITVAGEEVELTPDEVLVQVESQADFDVETDGRFVVWLDTQLDEELVLEGLAREVVNRVNGLRKERGLAVEDRIRLRVSPGNSRELALALEKHSALIANETLAVEILPLDTSAEAAPRFDLGQGRELRCDLTRV